MTGDYSTPDFRTRFTTQARLAAERSDLIIAVSQFTADQVHDLLKVERSRIRVVHHGTDAQPGNRNSSEHLTLIVGALKQRQTVGARVQALEKTDAGTGWAWAGWAGDGGGRHRAGPGGTHRG